MFVNHGRVKLGSGEQAFRRAVEALRQWRMFPTWIRLWPAELPLAEGNVVAIVARCFGVWTVNACRIVYVVDEPGEVQRYGFAYGTLQGHAMTGEERFLVTWDRSDDSVWYDVWSFSKPGHWTARLAARLVRRIQRKFARESCAAMRTAVTSVPGRAIDTGLTRESVQIV
jgi:uncharacterized protein (UPF0548 family)